MKFNLSGSWRLGWQDGFRAMTRDPLAANADESLFIDAQVPGSVYLDLIQAGLIQDPNMGLNSLSARWVEQCTWWYRRTFEAPREALNSKAWLVFDELDLNARVVLNGVEVARHRNVFRPLRAEVSEQLRAGTNTLAVELDAGTPLSGWHTVETPPDWGPRRREWLRKPQYQFGWDWSVRYVNVGIGGEVWLEWPDGDLRVDDLSPLVEVSPDLTSATVRARLTVQNLHNEPLLATMTAMVGGASANAGIEILPGEQIVELPLTVEEPQLWWPCGHGQATLHELNVELAFGGKIERRTAKIGFRRVEIRQDARPDGGSSFVLHINNRPIFCKGANLAPLDLIRSRVDADRYEQLVELLLEANLNFVRINGTGIYETDCFYELCDKSGIMVWQDFPFSVGRYPANEQGFLDEVRSEIRHQVRRLAGHPSLVVWCGSNETEWVYWDSEAGRSADLPDRYLFRTFIPELLEVEDPTRFYVPSSPWSPGDAYPNAVDRGDQHPWGVGFSNWDFRDYRTMTCTFADEGGIIGPPALPTIEVCLPDGHNHMRSVAWHLHDNAIGGQAPSWSEQMLEKLTGIDPTTLSVSEYAYWGGLLQGEGLREYIENFRRRMFDSAAACFWSFNDSWPTTRGWTIVDYFLRCTPAYWAVRRAAAPVHVVVALDDSIVNIYGINDQQDSIRAELASGFFTTDGGEVASASQEVVLEPNASTLIRSLGEWKGAPSEAIAFALLTRPDEPDVRSRLILPTFGELKWGEPTLTVRCVDGRAVFESDRFIWGVCIDLGGDKSLPDNFFDVWPGMPYSLPWTGSLPEVVRIGNLSVTTADQ